MEWYKLAINPRAIAELYTEVPVLNNIRLHGLTLHQDGAKLVLVLELPRFPDHIPARWKRQKYTVVFVRLEFWSLKDISISFNVLNDFVDVSCVKEIDGIHIAVFSSSVAIVSATAEICYIVVEKK